MGEHKMQWLCHTPNLLKEVVECNPTTWVLRMPILLLRRILVDLAEHAIRLDDPELNILMLRLTLYDVPSQDIPARIEEQRARLKEAEK